MSIVQVCRGCQKERQPPIEGPCPHCGGYLRTVPRRGRGGLAEEDEGDALPEGPVPVGALLDRPNSVLPKHPTGLLGVDHVFGGGLPEKRVVLFTGEEGTGKTSFLVELLLTLPLRSLLLSSEQGKEDIIQQFGRFGTERIQRASKFMSVEAETDFSAILATIESYKPQVLALDSLHEVEGVFDDRERPMASNSDQAVCRVAKVVKRLSRKLGFFGFLVGHMANDGTFMGGAHMRHAVDAKLLLSKLHGDKDPRRLLRFSGKVRFAPLGREALFKMTETGFRDCGPFHDKDEDGDEDEPKDPKPTGTPKLRLVN